jgi:hypothetical protein
MWQGVEWEGARAGRLPRHDFPRRDVAMWKARSGSRRGAKLPSGRKVLLPSHTEDMEEVFFRAMEALAYRNGQLTCLARFQR